MARGNAAARKVEAASKARAKKDAKQAEKVSKQQKKNEAVFEKALSKFSNAALDSAAGTNGKKKRESHVFRCHPQFLPMTWFIHLLLINTKVLDIFCGSLLRFSNCK